MGTQDLLLLISGITIALTTVIGSIFAGWIAIKQLPRAEAQRAAVAQQAQVDLRDVTIAATAAPPPPPIVVNATLKDGGE